MQRVLNAVGRERVSLVIKGSRKKQREKALMELLNNAALTGINIPAA